MLLSRVRSRRPLAAAAAAATRGFTLIELMVVLVIIKPVPMAPRIFSSVVPLRFKTLMESRISVSTE
jgi:hypothetical protein